MAEEINDLKRLSPKERIDKLKKLQEKNKKEIQEAQKLLKDAEVEVETEEKEKKDIPIPQLKSVDIEQLFTPEERELFKAKRLEADKKKKEEKKAEKKKELEDIAEFAPRLPLEEERRHIEYLNQLSTKPTEELYNKAKDIYSQFKEQGYLTAEQQNEFNNIEYANRKKLEDIEQGKYTEVSQKVTREMVLIEKMKHAVRYRR